MIDYQSRALAAAEQAGELRRKVAAAEAAKVAEKAAEEARRRQAEIEQIERERRYAEQSREADRIEAIRASEQPAEGNAHLSGVFARYKTGCEVRRKAIRETYEGTIRHHGGWSRIDFHELPFEGKILFLAPYLDLQVGGAYPRLDLVRSNPVAHEYVFVTHHGPADPERWRDLLPLVNRYLGGAWTVEPLDGTSLVLSRMPELPAVIPFDASLLRRGEILLGIEQTTGQPYYVPLSRLTHVLVGGQSGVGKSVLLNQCLRSLLFNLDLIDELVLVDLKGGVELSRYKDLSPKVRVVKSYDDLPELAERLVATMYERLAALERQGELAVKSGFRLVIIDEFAAIQQRTFRSKEDKERHAGLIANLNLLAQQARAAGIKLWAQLQKPTADNMDTSFRTNLQSVVCFYMPSKINATSMFGELDGLPADPTRLGKGEFVLRDDAQNRTVLLKSTFCDEHDIDGLRALVHPDCRMPEGT